MDYRRGGVYLANFNPAKGSEAGKIRPCVVMQNDLLNQAGHPSTTILPMTSHLIEDAAPLRVRINAREGLRLDSDVMIDQIRTVDNRRFCSGLLTLVDALEMMQIETSMQIVLGFEN